MLTTAELVSWAKDSPTETQLVWPLSSSHLEWPLRPVCELTSLPRQLVQTLEYLLACDDPGPTDHPVQLVVIRRRGRGCLD